MQRLLVTLLAVLLAVQLGACRQSGPRPRTVTIANDATFPPFHYLDEQGRVAGYDVAVAAEACRRAGYSPSIVHATDYDGMFRDLLAHRVDMVAATTGITPERERVYLFTRAYFETCQAALVRAAEARTIDDLRGRRVGAAGSGTSHRAMMALEGVERVRVGPGESGLEMLRAGEIDALVIDEFEVVALARDDPGLGVVAEPVAPERYAIVLAPDAHELKSALDAALREMERDGTMARLRREHGLVRPPDWPVDLD